jgi:DNA transposition AAA+ family ATPase
MSMSNPMGTDHFLITKAYRQFEEFCDACRRYRYIGLCYGVAGVGKTWSARMYTQWARLEALLAQPLRDQPVAPAIMTCRTLFYTAPVTATPERIEREIGELRRQFNKLLKEMELALQDVQLYAYPMPIPDLVELLIVDEADRLKPVALEQLRDFYDRSAIGLVLIGLPGLEKRLARYPQLYSRVGFVHHFKPLNAEEMGFVLKYKWQQLGLTLDFSDFTDAEAMAAIIRITGGNFRLLQRLLSQIERVRQINELHYVTKEVVESARELLIIGSTAG